MLTENIKYLINIHNEMNLILKELIEYEDNENDDDYVDLIRDFEWDKKMLKNRLDALKLEKDSP